MLGNDAGQEHLALHCTYLPECNTEFCVVCAESRTALDGDMLSQFLLLPAPVQQRMLAAAQPPATQVLNGLASPMGTPSKQILLYHMIKILETALSAYSNI